MCCTLFCEVFLFQAFILFNTPLILEGELLFSSVELVSFGVGR